MIEKEKTVSILAIGTLRADIYLNYDFSIPMSEMEVKLTNYSRKIGGSVYNTCQFISNYSNNIEVTMYTLNHVSLIDELANNTSTNSINILTTDEPIFTYPMSIVGVDCTGEKRMLIIESASPPLCPNDILSLQSQSKSDLFCTSFYEINDKNLNFVCSLCACFLNQGKYTMSDLCPLINHLDAEIITKVLKCTSVLSGHKLEYEKLVKNWSF